MLPPGWLLPIPSPQAACVAQGHTGRPRTAGQRPEQEREAAAASSRAAHTERAPRVGSQNPRISVGGLAEPQTLNDTRQSQIPGTGCYLLALSDW